MDNLKFLSALPQAMTAVEILQTKFAEAQRNRGECMMQLAAQERDEQELNMKLIRLLQSGEDASPILIELRDLMVQRAQMLTAFAEGSTAMAGLCREYVDVLGKLID